MSTKVRRNRWKGRKWVDTAFARHYRKQVSGIDFMCGAQGAMISSQGLSIVSQIRFSPGDSVTRKMAIAEAVVKTHEAIANVFRRRNDMVEPINKRWRVS